MTTSKCIKECFHTVCCSCGKTHSLVSEPNWKDYPETDIRVEDPQKEHHLTMKELKELRGKKITIPTPQTYTDWAEDKLDSIVVEDLMVLKEIYDLPENCLIDLKSFIHHQKELSFKEGARIERERIKEKLNKLYDRDLQRDTMVYLEDIINLLK